MVLEKAAIRRDHSYAAPDVVREAAAFGVILTTVKHVLDRSYVYSGASRPRTTPERAKIPADGASGGRMLLSTPGHRPKANGSKDRGGAV